MSLETRHFQFGPFRLYPSEHLLMREREALPLAPKVFEILVHLVRHSGHLVSREQLMKAIWPDSFVEENNLTVNISILRKVLGDASDGHPYIETVPRKGYRFHAGVTEASDQPEVALAVAAAPQALPLAAPQFKVIPAAPSPPPGRPSIRPSLFTIVSLLALVALVIAGFSYRNRILRTSVKAGAPSLAVLPFRSLGADADDAYLGMGMTDALITRLGSLHRVVVRPVGAVRKYAAEDPIIAGRKLSADTILEGGIQRDGDRTRVTVRLLRVADGELLWSDRFDEKLTDTFAIEDSISQRVAAALALNLSSAEQRRLTRPFTANPQAYQLYMKGRFFWNKRSADSLKTALGYFHQAIAADPGYALAYAGLADAYISAGSYGYSMMPPTDAMPRAKAAAQKALAIDDSLAEAHTSLAYIHFTYDWDWAAAEQEFKRAIELNPGYDTAHHWYSHLLAAQGRFPESFAESRRAQQISPSDTVMNEHMGWHFLMVRDYPRAVEFCNKAIEMDPDFLLAHRVLGEAYLYQSRFPEAIAEFEKGVALSHSDPVAQAYLARAYADSAAHSDDPAQARSERARAEKYLAALEHISTERYVSPAEIATVQASLGHIDQAFEWLDRAYDERSSALIYLKVDRSFDPLRGDSRFQELQQRMKLN
ncbi:MAG: winged helix-turn-helix domain-containing protein [Acidobacteriaceae bacterium]